jgi:predicted RNase H-like HicB family nuclease
MRYAIVIEKGKKNYSAYAPDVPGCGVAGKTVAETLSLMREALEFHFEGTAEDGLPIPDPECLVAYVDVKTPAEASGTVRPAAAPKVEPHRRQKRSA